MPVRPEDMDRLLAAIKGKSDWESKLISANYLFHQGSSQYESAVNKYGKIIELLLRELFREISLVLPPKEKTNFLTIESQIGHGKPFGNFGLGETISFFSQTKIFDLLNGYVKSPIFDSNRLIEMNNFRVNQTHYDVKIEKSRVDNIRKDVTCILLDLKLIASDPEKIIITKGEAKESQTKEKKQNGMQQIVTRIRCELLDNSKIDHIEEIIRNDGWSAQVQAKMDIAGVYAEKTDLAAIVRVLELDTPIDDPDEIYDNLNQKIQEFIGKIAPEVKGKIKVLFFEEYEEHGLEKAAYVVF